MHLHFDPANMKSNTNNDSLLEVTPLTDAASLLVRVSVAPEPDAAMVLKWSSLWQKRKELLGKILQTNWANTNSTHADRTCLQCEAALGHLEHNQT